MKLLLPSIESYDSITESFINYPSIEVDMEYSLYTISKWEEVYCKPFLTTFKESRGDLDFIKSYVPFLFTTEIPLYYIEHLSQQTYSQIIIYMNHPSTATTFKETITRATAPILTTEQIYVSMFTNGIDISCEHWHFNRLMTLLRVLSTPVKKMSKKSILQQNAELNAARRKKLGTRG